MLGPLVLGVAPRRHPQHQQLPLAGRERRGEEDVAVEGVERAGERGVVGEHPERVQPLGTVGVTRRERVAGDRWVQRRERILHLLGPLAGRERRDPQDCRSPIIQCSARR